MLCTRNDKAQAMANEKILIWLPSPIGDAVLATPALRSIRNAFPDAHIVFLASKAVMQLLSPSDFCDMWYCPDDTNPLKVASQLRKQKFTHAILLKNSFSCALAVWLGGIPARIGYSRQGRGFMLTDKLYAPKLDNGKFKPRSMVDYYLDIAEKLNGNCRNKTLELKIDNDDLKTVESKIAFDKSKPAIILVPGGAFGPSKCWASDRFAKTADLLIEKYNAQVFINVAPKPEELNIADEIISHSNHEIINLGQFGLTLGQIKAAISKAALVITNDTGPRHIAIALGKKVVTLFGPNDPVWTDTKWEKEIQIVGTADCAPCAKKICFLDKHICMDSITVQQVFDSARRLIDAP
jgi:heptosyltransferase-2